MSSLAMRAASQLGWLAGWLLIAGQPQCAEYNLSQVVVLHYKRRRAAVDYRKLAAEMFGGIPVRKEGSRQPAHSWHGLGRPAAWVAGGRDGAAVLKRE